MTEWNKLKAKLMDNPKVLMKFEILMKHFGFNQIEERKDIKYDTVFEDLTFIAKPDNTDNKELNEEMRKFLEGLNEGLPTWIWDFEKPKEAQVFTLKFKDKEIEMGFYFKERNYFLMTYPLFSISTFKDRKRDFLNEFFKQFQAFCEEVKIEKVDISHIAEKIMALRINKAWESKVKDSQENLKRNLRDTEDYNRNLKDLYDQRLIIMQEIKSYKEGQEAGIEKTRKMIEELKKLKFLKGVQFTTEGIELDYGEININYEGKDVYIGKFKATITPEKVTIQNLDPVLVVNNKTDLRETGTTYKHPHIDTHYSGNDAVCFGSARANLITKLRADLEFGRIARQILLFLKSYNADDCYNAIAYYKNAFIKNGKHYILDNYYDDDDDYDDSDDDEEDY